MVITKLLISLLILTNFRADRLPRLQTGGQEQLSAAAALIDEAISRIADEFDYRSFRAYSVIPDEWDTDERRVLLDSHVYYSLYSRDPDSLLDLGPMHQGVSRKHIRALILLFKDTDLADTELLQLRKKIEGDIGAEVVKESETGFAITTVFRSQIVVRRGARVILLETDKQHETMRAMAEKLEQANW
jgi:hypothetical protein